MERKQLDNDNTKYTHHVYIHGEEGRGTYNRYNKSTHAHTQRHAPYDAPPPPDGLSQYAPFDAPHPLPLMVYLTPHITGVSDIWRSHNVLASFRCLRADQHKQPLHGRSQITAVWIPSLLRPNKDTYTHAPCFAAFVCQKGVVGVALHSGYPRLGRRVDCWLEATEPPASGSCGHQWALPGLVVQTGDNPPNVQPVAPRDVGTESGDLTCAPDCWGQVPMFPCRRPAA